MPFPIRKVQTQYEKVIDYQYIRNLKNKEVRKNRFKRTLSQQIFRFFLMAVLVGELAYLGYLGFQIFKGSSLFALNNVVITGTKHTRFEEIKKLVLATNNNVITADLTQIKLRLEAHPWIQSAVLWRELPGTIRVHITERYPIALVLSGNLYLVDHSGRIIHVFDQDPQYAGLPVITGITDVSNEAQVRAALAYVEILRADPAVLRQISEIHYYDKYSTIVYLKGYPFGLLVSQDGILPMIRKLIHYADFLKANFANQKVIDLRYEDQIILKNGYKEQL